MLAHNKRAIDLPKATLTSYNSTHIDQRYHALRGLVETGYLSAQYVFCERHSTTVETVVEGCVYIHRRYMQLFFGRKV